MLAGLDSPAHAEILFIYLKRSSVQIPVLGLKVRYSMRSSAVALRSPRGPMYRRRGDAFLLTAVLKSGYELLRTSVFLSRVRW